MAMILFVGIVAAAQTFGFSGGVTGYPNNGKVWAQWSRARGLNNRVVVYARGKTTTKAYANNQRNAYTTAARKWSGNIAYWNRY